MNGSNILITGGCGFIGSNFTKYLIDNIKYNKIIVLDDLSDGNTIFRCEQLFYYKLDITNYSKIVNYFKDINYVFHFAAKARTPICINYPLLANNVNVTGTLNVLESSRVHNVKRVVLSSSNVVLAGETLYKYSKQCNENYAKVYNELYNQSIIVIRYSNVYGLGQREDVEGPNVFAAFRKSKKEYGKIFVTGDGKQSRDFTHINDIVRANLLASKSNYKGCVDICTGINTDLNTIITKYFKCPIEYIDDRPGDKKHIFQDPEPAKKLINYKFSILLEGGIEDVL